MKRVNFHIPEPQIKILKNIVSKTGLSMAELVRRAIDKFLESFKIVL